MIARDLIKSGCDGWYHEKDVVIVSTSWCHGRNLAISSDLVMARLGKSINRAEVVTHFETSVVAWEEQGTRVGD